MFRESNNQRPKHDIQRTTKAEATDEEKRVSTGNIALHDHHSIRGQRPGLVGTYRARISHRLASIQMSNQVVVRHHFLHKNHLKILDF